MELVKRTKTSVIACCEKCHREIEIPYSNTVRPHMPSIELKNVVQCECGEYHNLIVDQKNLKQKERSTTIVEDTLSCPKCKSTQLHAGNKGFGLGKAAAGGILLGPVGLLGGLVGSKKVMITCLKCGHKWQAGKQ